MEPITILLPVREPPTCFLSDAIGSVLNQTSPHWRLIVIGEAPCEGVSDVIKRHFSESPIQVILNSGKLLSGAINTGLKAASTEFVCLLLGDDMLSPNAIAKLQEQIAAHSTADVFHSSRLIINELGKVIGRRLVVDRFTSSDWVEGSVVKHLICFRRERALSIGGVDETLGLHGADDYDFPWCMAEAGFSFVPISEPLYWYREHNNGFRLTTHVAPELQASELEKIFRKHGVSQREIERQIQKRMEFYVGGGGSSGASSFFVPSSYGAERNFQTTYGAGIQSNESRREGLSVQDERGPWSAVVFPDRHPELAERAVRSLSACRHAPHQTICIPPQGIFPERRAWQWALQFASTEYVAQIDADMTLYPDSIEGILKQFGPEVGCVASLLKDNLRGSIGYVKFWRTDVLKQITFGEASIRPLNVDVDYAETAERLGWKFVRSQEVVGTHEIVLEPFNVFRVYFRIGVKLRGRNLLGTPANRWGIDGLDVKSSWGQIALLGYHCGIQTDYDGDPHDSAWDNFVLQRYQNVEPFCNALIPKERCIKTTEKDSKIAVMFVAPSLYSGGVENSIINIAAGLDRRRFAPSIAYEFGNDASLIARARAAQIPVFQLLGSPQLENTSVHWERLLASQRPNIIISTLATRAPLVAARLGIAAIERPPGWNGHSGLKKCLFDLVVCESATFRSELLNRPEFEAVSGRTRVIYNGVDLNRFESRNRETSRMALGLRSDCLIVLALSRVHPVKNLPMQLRGLKHALDAGVDAELHIVGQTALPDELDEKSALEKLAKELQIAQRVFFHGVVSNPAEFLSAADVVALTSLTEGAPNALLEAMAMKKPIIATDVGAIKEITCGKAIFVASSVDFGNALARPNLAESIDYAHFAPLHDLNRTNKEWEHILEEVYLRKHENLPYSFGRVKVAFICENLNIGGMEVFVKIMDEMIDRTQFETFIYSHESGDLLPDMKSKVRVIPASSWTIVDQKMRDWLFTDGIEVAIVISYGRIDSVLSQGKPCKVIERVDGAFIDLVRNRTVIDAVVFQADSIRSELESTIGCSRQFTIYNGRKLSDFSRQESLRQVLRRRLRVRDSEVLIANVGRLAKQKDHMILLAVVTSLIERGYYQFKLVIMGPDQGEKYNIEQEILRRGIEQFVVIRDGSTDGPRSLLSAADVYVQSSKQEGLSGSLIEAAAAGLPIIATNVGATRELVDESNGALIEPADLNALVSSIEKFLTDPAARKQCGMESLRRSKAYCAKQMVSEYEKLIEDFAMERRKEETYLPEITIVISVYDRVQYLDQAIQSVLCQTSPRWRLLIAVDTIEPTDKLLEVLRSHEDTRISHMCTPHRNHCATINKAVRGVQTEYIMRLDSDDTLEPHAVATVLAEIARDQTAGYFYCSKTTVDENHASIRNGELGPVWEAEEYSPERLEEWFIASQAIAWRRSDFIAIGGYAEDLPYGEDYLLALSMQLTGVKFKAIKESLYNYRIHKDSGITNSYNSNEQRFFIDVVRKRYLDGKRTLALSWRGESPDTMRPRRRVKADYGSDALTNQEALDHAFTFANSNRIDREIGFAKIYNRLEQPSVEIVTQLCELMWKIGDLESSAIDVLRVIYVRHRSRLSTRKALLARQQYLALAANGCERGLVAVGADLVEHGAPKEALEYCTGKSGLSSEPWCDLLLYTGLRAYLEIPLVPESLRGLGDAFASTLLDRLGGKSVRELINRKLDDVFLVTSACASYIKLRQDVAWAQAHPKHPLFEVSTDILDLEVGSSLQQDFIEVKAKVTISRG
jgi:glycosyltransferase involved in cell wall biosynthesis